MLFKSVLPMQPVRRWQDIYFFIGFLYLFWLCHSQLSDLFFVFPNFLKLSVNFLSSVSFCIGGKGTGDSGEACLSHCSISLKFSLINQTEENASKILILVSKSHSDGAQEISIYGKFVSTFLLMNYDYSLQKHWRLPMKCFAVFDN